MFGKYGVDEQFNNEKNSILKMSQAINSTLNGDIKYMAGQLCEMIIRKQQGLHGNVIDINDKNTRFWTPFSRKIGVKLSIGKGYIVPPIGTQGARIHDLLVRGGALSSYNSIANAISGRYNKKHLEIIYNYLNMKSDPSIQNLDDFNEKVRKTWGNAGTDLFRKTRVALNYLSAILMVAEPFRFRDQGRQSRALIRLMYQNFKPNHQSPTKPVLSKKSESSHPMVRTGAAKIARKNLQCLNKASDPYSKYTSEDEDESDYKEPHKISKKKKQETKPKKEIKVKKVSKKTKQPKKKTTKK